MVQVCNNLLCRRRHDAAACGFAVEAACSYVARINNSYNSPRLNSMDEEEPSPHVNYEEEYNDDEREEEDGEEEEIPSGPSRDWLRLGPGLPPPSDNVVKRQQALRELDLFGDSASSSSSPSAVAAAAPVIQLFPPPVPWGMRWSSSSTGALAGGNSNIFARSWTPTVMPPTAQFALPLGRLEAAAQPAEAWAGIRVVNPPRRQTGIWIILEAAKDQGRQPDLLPQIPNNYLRIKDGRLSVELLMKYLVKKLGLEDESEVEITCRGQQLHPCLTLQYVRDSVWRLSNAIDWMLPDSGSIEHVMRLQYRRSARRSLGLV